MAKVKITLAELTVVVQAAVEVATDTRRGYRDDSLVVVIVVVL